MKSLNILAASGIMRPLCAVIMDRIIMNQQLFFKLLRAERVSYTFIFSCKSSLLDLLT